LEFPKPRRMMGAKKPRVKGAYSKTKGPQGKTEIRKKRRDKKSLYLSEQASTGGIYRREREGSIFAKRFCNRKLRRENGAGKNFGCRVQKGIEDESRENFLRKDYQKAEEGYYDLSSNGALFGTHLTPGKKKNIEVLKTCLKGC